jgi:glycerophosphoryl diester phosphodiesterase
MTKPQIFAHRGAKSVAPENTLPAFARALEMGVDGVELDVQCSADGQLVVIHDFQVDRLTDGAGAVSSFSVADLQQLDAGSHFSAEFAGTQIPTLLQVLDLLQDRCRINIEIKTHDPTGGEEVDHLAQLIRQRDLYQQAIVSSFNPVSLIKLRWLEPQVALGLLYVHRLPAHLQNAWLSPIIAPQALHPHHDMVDRAHVDWAHDAGYAVNTWTVNDVDEAQRLAALGVDVIMSDVPDQLLEALR